MVMNKLYINPAFISKPDVQPRSAPARR